MRVRDELGARVSGSRVTFGVYCLELERFRIWGLAFGVLGGVGFRGWVSLRFTLNYHGHYYKPKYGTNRDLSRK